MFLDTAGLLCLLYKDDPRHNAAVAHSAAARDQMTHNYVLTELVALAHIRRLDRRMILRYSAEILHSSVVKLYWIDEATHRAAVALLHKRPDKTYSLCDAVSFVLMKRLSITHALTTDHHFEQEGFHRLLDGT